jgi:aspartyl/asparaginyl-tRNA synthetase
MHCVDQQSDPSDVIRGKACADAVPHAGFALGFERTLAYLTGLANVRDAIPFPRTPGNARY